MVPAMMDNLKVFLRWFLVAYAVILVIGAPHQHDLKPSVVPGEVPDISDLEAESLLRQFMVDDQTPNENVTLEVMLRSYQRYYGLPETGELNNETKVILSAPKCERVKRSLGTRWSKRSLTYSINSFPEGYDSVTVRWVLEMAFSSWSAVTRLDFKEVDSQADIGIEFGGVEHGGGNSKICRFSGPSVLAHAAYPEVGYIHFNTEYFFSKIRSLPFFMDTALHEIGHALGLEHTNDKGSVMYPFSNEMKLFFKPPPIDVKNIQQLYGVRETIDFDVDMPTLCSLDKIDAAFKDGDGNSYIFAGDYYFDASRPNATGKLISSKWFGLPGNIDAAFWHDNQTYFFKGEQYWVYVGSNPIERRAISIGFPGLPNGLDAVLVLGGGDLIIAFKGSQFWHYLFWVKHAFESDRLVDLGLFKNKVDAALESTDGMIIFEGRDVYSWENGDVSLSNLKSWFQC